MTSKKRIGECWVCGCTDMDCTGCVERTGEPCTWADKQRTLCSACLALLARSIAVARPARTPWFQEWLRTNRISTIGDLCHPRLDSSASHLGQKFERLRSRAHAWLRKMTRVGPMGASAEQIAAATAH